MRTPGPSQLAAWLVIGAAALAFLKWQDDDIGRASIAPAPFILDSSAVLEKSDALPKPFARLKSPIGLNPRTIPTLLKRPRLRAVPGEPVSVTVTAYCLQGRTRLGTQVREGTIAADPRVFPLNAEIDLVVGKDTLGRFRVEDTGLLIKGRVLDIWLPTCSQARAFGRKRGQATLASKTRR